jgi:hypothetical protein
VFTLVFFAAFLLSHSLSAPHLRVVKTKQVQWKTHSGARLSRAGLWAHAGLRSMKLRGAGDAMDVEASGASPPVTAAAEGESPGASALGSSGEIFDALLVQSNRIGFLSDAYANGDNATKQQAVDYTALLMSEEGFLENMTPLQVSLMRTTLPGCCACHLCPFFHHHTVPRFAPLRFLQTLNTDPPIPRPLTAARPLHQESRACPRLCKFLAQ